MSNIFYEEEEDEEEDRYLSFKVPHSGGEKYIIMQFVLHTQYAISM